MQCSSICSYKIQYDILENTLILHILHTDYRDSKPR